MDHLPEPLCPLDGPAPRLLFPCRCNPNDVDKGLLETYPERKGYHLNYWGDLNFANTLTLSDGSRPSVEQSTVLLQQWLFFGLLNAVHSIYGTEFDGNDYIYSVDEAVHLSLQRLPQDVDNWIRADSDKPKAIRKKNFHEFEAHLMRVLRFLTNNFTATTYGSLDHKGSFDHVVHERSRIVLESNLEILLVIFLEALCIVSKRVYFREWMGGMGPSPDEVCLSTHRLMNRPTWCPSELSLMDVCFNNGSYYFASRLVRTGAEARHSACTTSKCLAFQLKQSSYQTAHVKTCKGCREVVINPTDLTAILENGDENANPRIQIMISNRDEVDISVVCEGSYVAISHVWSDGMGHPLGVNSLPECQIRRLRFLIQQTGLKEPIVWIDSLCVPANLGSAKQKALAQMADVYRGANNVLVLDSDLLSIPSSCCNEELLMRIALSRWMRRLWTLEEGVLARPRLLFQLSDRSICLPLPKQSVTDSIAENCTALISAYLPAEASMMSVITALHFRSTSWIDDEPLCISYILDLATSSILSIDSLHHDLRMLELYRQLAKKDPVFPWKFLFTDEEKLNISPFRWAPMSLLSLEAHDVGYLRGKDSFATQTERGLQFQEEKLKSCLLSFSEGANIKKCMMITIDALSYVLCPVPKKGKCRSHARFWEGIDKQLSLDADPSRDWTENWQANYGIRPKDNWALIHDNSYGAIVAVDEQRDKLLYATYIGPIQMYEVQISYTSIVAGLNKEY